MRERKYVKFRVDMLSDTKAKIIDRKAERDLIHYVWMALVLLAGKVNLEGELYLSKNIPYTIETLAIEFNREIEQVKLALDVLIELEMIELTEHNVYIVKNFAKHQNIKVKDKNKAGNNEVNIDNKEVEVKPVAPKKDSDTENGLIKSEKNYVENNSENEIKQVDIDNSQNKNEKILPSIDNILSKTDENVNIARTDDIHKDENITNDKNYEETKRNDDYKENNTILLESKKSRGRYKNRSNDNLNALDEETEDDPDNTICFISEGEKPLREGERVVNKWSF